jgi:hypothetical protein
MAGDERVDDLLVVQNVVQTGYFKVVNRQAQQEQQ